MRYVLDFGIANAGAPVPTWVSFTRLDTLAAVAQPTIVDVGDGSGQFYFDLDWSTTTATSIAFKATKGGIELSDVISSPDVLLPGATTASAGTSSLVGYSTVGVIVARAGTQAGVLNLNPVDQATYDPFASTDPQIVQMLELLNSLGQELTGKLRAHHIREFTFTTAASETSYAMPADYVEMVPDTGWDRTGVRPLYGPVTSARAQYIKARGVGATVQVEFRIEGNRMTFPVAPPDGLMISGEYFSEFWIQTAASGTGPDADHATDRTDYALFDPLLLVLGLRLRYREAKGLDTTLILAAYEDRYEKAKGRAGGAGTLSLNQSAYGLRLADGCNYPATLG